MVLGLPGGKACSLVTGPEAQPVLRTATPDDVERLTELVQMAYGPYVDRIGQKPGPMLDDYNERIIEAQVDVLTIGTEILGMMITQTRPDFLLLENVALDPSVQGKGYARLLMKSAEALARAAGYSRIVLYTHEKMTENRAIYARLGFAECDTRLERGLRRVYMEKTLD